MKSARKNLGSSALLATVLAAVAAIVWAPSWLPFVVLGVGAAWYVQSRPARPGLGAAVLAAILALAVLSSVYGVGKDMALRDNARADATR